jgi:hypothetical protein
LSNDEFVWLTQHPRAVAFWFLVACSLLLLFAGALRDRR